MVYLIFVYQIVGQKSWCFVDPRGMLGCYILSNLHARARLVTTSVNEDVVVNGVYIRGSFITRVGGVLASFPRRVTEYSRVKDLT